MTRTLTRTPLAAAWPCCLAIVVMLAAAPRALAALRENRTSGARAATPVRGTAFELARRIDANRINMFESNVGLFAYDYRPAEFTAFPGLIWPRGTNQSVVFASGLWLGARVNGQVRVATADYSSEYGSGGMVGGGPDDPSRPEHRVYKMVRWTGNPADSSHVERTPAELAADPRLDPLEHHSWSEYIAGARPYGASTRTYRLPDPSTPQPDDSVDVEGPDVLGDQMLWHVFNDANPALHTSDRGATAPLGVEIQKTTFAFDQPNGLADIVFMRFRILNKGGNTLENMVLSLFSDPDVGEYTDDLVGCDVGRGVGFGYNADNDDRVYGSSPPAVGYVVLRGPVDPGTGTHLGLTALSDHEDLNDPDGALETYNSMQGLLVDGTSVIDPTTGQPTRYFYPGDPVTGSGWVGRGGADRRILLGSGPTRMLPGESQELWAAIVVGRGQDRLSSVAAMRCGADLARSVFEQGFSLPGPVPSCEVAAVNCPKPAEFWGLECAASGSGSLTTPQLTQVAEFVGQQAALFDWPTNTLGSFCGAVGPPGTPDLRQSAHKEFASFLANYGGNQVGLWVEGDRRIRLLPETPVACPPLRAGTIAELASNASLLPVLRDADYLDLVPTNPPGLVGTSSFLPFFGGGAAEAYQLFGSTLYPWAHPDSFTTVEIRFSATNTQKVYRYLRLEKSGGGSPGNVGRRYPYSGFYDCDFQVWDVDHDVQLDAAFVERALVVDDNGTLSPDTSTAIPTMDRTWNPDDSPFGGLEYLFVFNRPYSPTPKDALRLDNRLGSGYPALYVLSARRPTASAVIDDGDAFRFWWGRPPSPGADSLLVELQGLPLADPSVQQAYQNLVDCLSQLNAGVGVGETCESSTPTLVSLVSAEASADRVTLRWYVPGPGILAAVERRVPGENWIEVGRVIAGGDGHLGFEDRDLAPGWYEYRLALEAGGVIEHGGHARVQVGAPATLAFLGARVGPGDRRLAVSFSLAGREPARLELLDIAGRRLVVRDLADPAPGVRALDLEASARLSAGIYLVRITQGARRVAGKAAIIR